MTRSRSRRECRQSGSTSRKADEIVRGWRMLDRALAKRPGAWAEIVHAMARAQQRREAGSEYRNF